MCLKTRSWALCPTEPQAPPAAVTLPALEVLVACCLSCLDLPWEGTSFQNRLCLSSAQEMGEDFVPGDRIPSILIHGYPRRVFPHIRLEGM